MKRVIDCLLLFVCLSLLSGCAITHKYGPYRGKVIDKETGEPLAGAVVFMKVNTVAASLAGGVSTFYDAMEVLTDEKGEFYLDPPRMWRFPRGIESWDMSYVKIFKPGYGVYPDHPQSTRPSSEWRDLLPADEYVVIRLLKLKTVEERKRNVGNAASYGMEKIPREKQQKILELYNSELKALGLPTEMTK